MPEALSCHLHWERFERGVERIYSSLYICWLKKFFFLAYKTKEYFLHMMITIVFNIKNLCKQRKNNFLNNNKTFLDCNSCIFYTNVSISVWKFVSQLQKNTFQTSKEIFLLHPSFNFLQANHVRKNFTTHTNMQFSNRKKIDKNIPFTHIYWSFFTQTHTRICVSLYLLFIIVAVRCTVLIFSEANACGKCIILK